MFMFQLFQLYPRKQYYSITTLNIHMYVSYAIHNKDYMLYYYICPMYGLVTTECLNVASRCGVYTYVRICVCVCII